MEYYRPLHLIFLTPLELGRLWRTSMFEEIGKEMKNRGYSFFDIATDSTKLESVADVAVDKRLKQKEDIEIFFSLSSCLAFFGKREGKIGFPLADSFDPRKTPIQTLEDLKAASKEYHLTDFAISYKHDEKYNICEFQLKQYKLEITTKKLLEEMKKMIKKYGYNLGTTNIIFNLQGNGPPFSKYDIDFEKIHDEIKKFIDSKTTGHVYIKYNNQNTQSVIIEVYPKLVKSEVQFTNEELKIALKEK